MIMEENKNLTAEEYKKIKEEYNEKKIKKLNNKSKRSKYIYVASLVLMMVLIIGGSLIYFNHKEGKYTYLMRRIGSTQFEVVKDATCTTDVSGNRFCLLKNRDSVHVKNYQVIWLWSDEN